MQAQAARVYPSSTTGSTSTPGPVTGALRVVEAFLLRGGQQTARRNAWTAVLEDRRRAKDRRDAQHVLEALSSKRSANTGLIDFADFTELGDLT
ncbi:hypothetical protein NGB36_13640 [Streptomyces sp. RB6PN25]|uniref:Uncharacterized protein n=1 Tax=Streptomyces humicola TaxID=2953240 RepID=A0ABT1PVB8_9ACTN|nr:hypothetical protein [Streptomyces humicola]MCQ4081621.1 hypothetical protein [Streptomyces humicola]